MGQQLHFERDGFEYNGVYDQEKQILHLNTFDEELKMDIRISCRDAESSQRRQDDLRHMIAKSAADYYNGANK